MVVGPSVQLYPEILDVCASRCTDCEQFLLGGFECHHVRVGGVRLLT